MKYSWNQKGEEIHVRFDNFLIHSFRDIGVKAGRLDRRSLLEKRVGFGFGRDESYPLVGIFRANVPAYRTAFKQNESIVILSGDE
jgi:hypothetical protein